MSSDPLPTPTSLPPASPTKPLPKDPFPPRSISPPLPPRKNASGLPPTYLRHLRKLLHQWLEQQIRIAKDTTLSTAGKRKGLVDDERLWSDDKIQALEQAIWEGAVVPQLACRDGKRARALLELDWAEWSKGAMRRKAIWKKKQDEKLLAEAFSGTTKDEAIAKDTKGGKQSRKSSINESDPFGKGRLTIPGSPLPSSSTLPTPARTPSRPSSVASSSRSPTLTPVPAVPATPSHQDKIHEENEDSGDEENDQMHRWCQSIASLKGYKPLCVPKKDEWEVVQDDFPKYGTIQRDVPGAFPQSTQYDYRTSQDELHLTASSSRTRFSDLGLPTPVSLQHTPKFRSELLKPVFCLHFPSQSSYQTASSSTLRLKRDNSLGKKSISSIGSGDDNKKWWNGSGGRWSEMTIGPKSTTQPEEPLEVNFVEGQFSLPTVKGNKGTWRQSMLKRSNEKRKSVMDAFIGSSDRSSLHGDDLSSTSDAEAEESVADETEDTASLTSSRTHTGLDKMDRAAVSMIIAGAEDDVPQQKAGEDEIGIVGGTIIIKGLQDDEERKALQRILQLLIYTVQSMTLELELLDTFRIPRESDEPPLPPKITQGMASVPHSPTKPRKSVDLHRKGSLKEKGDKTKGFFHRLGKDTKHVWEGLLGKRRSSGSHEVLNESSLSTPNSPVIPINPPMDSLATPAGDSIPTSSKSPAIGLPSTSPMSHPTERHLAILSRLEEQIHSSTPAMRFPMPPLLLRLREEDRIRREKAKQEVQEGNANPLDGLPGNSPTLFTSSKFMNGHNGSANPLHGRALNYRLGGDVRAGLGALASGIDSFEGWIRLQRIEALYSVGLDTVADNGEEEVHICQNPTPQTYVYWDTERDKSIQQILDDLKDELSEEETMVCVRPGCTATPAEHVRWYAHGGKKIALKIESMDVQEVEENSIDVWSKCTVCGQIGLPKEMGCNTSTFSWGKLLEILLYTDMLHQAAICSHTSTSFYLRTPTLVISLLVDDVSVLDTRLPKLQVGPNVTKRKGGKEPVDAVMANILRKETGEEKISILREEIDLFFGDIDKKVENVRNHSEKKVEIDNGEPKDGEHPSVPPNQKSAESGTVVSKTADWETLVSDTQAIKLQLLEQVNSTSPSQINDVRHHFSQQIKVIKAKLNDCQKKHTTQQVFPEDDLSQIPEYAKGKGIFSPPGSSVLVRIDEPASIIAYTLSSLEYFSELTNTTKSGTISDDLTSATMKSDKSSGTSKSNSNPGTNIWSTDVKRRDTPRDVLGLRTITKKKSEIQISQPPKPLLGLSLAPNAPSLELSLEQVEGKSQSSDRLNDLVKTISKATAQDPILTFNAKSPVQATTTRTIAESDTDAMPRVRSSPRGMRRLMSDNDKASPPSAFRPATTRSVSNTSIAPSTTSSSRLEVTTSAVTPGGTAQKDGWGSVTSSFSNSFNQLLKLGSDVGESIGSIRVKGTDRSLSSLIGPLGMMSTVDNALSSIDDRPHIQFSYTLGDRLKLGCTVYYATAFDSLRRRCAIDRSMIQSLSRTNAWDAQGGKSKAAFFMTSDKRYIVKELVSKWNVSDTHALLEIAPAYFEHLAGTHNKATSLAKIVGFYTVRINDLQTGTKRQLDLLVMENLFYKQNISRTYDLKGIEGRKVKTKAEGENKGEIRIEGTLFDGEWLEGMQRGLVLVQPHAKRILQEAISLDTRFLSAQSIMDYSLLIGVDEGKHELVVGLVDAIGSYNLFKTIESRGKMALNRGGEVTIIPPDQYRERFENALKHYFIACPDKWSKSSRRSGIRKASSGVPSVL